MKYRIYEHHNGITGATHYTVKIVKFGISFTPKCNFLVDNFDSTPQWFSRLEVALKAIDNSFERFEKSKKSYKKVVKIINK